MEDEATALLLSLQPSFDAGVPVESVGSKTHLPLATVVKLVEWLRQQGLLLEESNGCFRTTALGRAAIETVLERRHAAH